MTCEYCQHSIMKPRNNDAVLFCEENAIWVYRGYTCNDYTRYPGADGDEDDYTSNRSGTIGP